MADGGGTSETILTRLYQDNLDCTICHQRYTVPKTLSCKHTFCLACLKKILVMKTKGLVICCPLCRSISTLPTGGNHDNNLAYLLPADFAVQTVVEEAKIQERASLCTGSKVKCQAGCEMEAVCHCEECDQTMCLRCKDLHQKWEVLRKHKINSLDELRVMNESVDVKPPNVFVQKIPKCDAHPEQDVSLYCKSCRQLICKTCTESGHKSQSHCFVTIDTAVRVGMQIVNELVDQGETVLNLRKICKDLPLLTSGSTHMQSRLSKMLDETNQKITLRVEEAIEQIRRKEQHLKDQAQKVYADKVKRIALEQRRRLNLQLVQRAESICSEGDLVKLLQECNVQQVFNAFGELRMASKAEDTLNHCWFVDFKESKSYKGHLGRVKANPYLKSHKTLHKRVGGSKLAYLSNGDVILVSFNQRHLTTLNANGFFVRAMTSSEVSDGIQNPTAVCVNKDDTIFVLDGSQVKIFTKENRPIHQFTPGALGSDGSPTCLAVDDNHVIAVGYEDKEEITLHNLDGSLIKTLPAPMIGAHLIMNTKSDLIYISKSQTPKLVAMDCHGNHLFATRLFEKSQFLVRGMCGDTAGDTYIIGTEKPDSKNPHGCIHHINKHGGYVGQYHTFHDCKDLAITKDGRFTVACKNSVYTSSLVEG